MLLWNKWRLGGGGMGIFGKHVASISEYAPWQPWCKNWLPARRRKRLSKINLHFIFHIFCGDKKWTKLRPNEINEMRKDQIKICTTTSIKSYKQMGYIFKFKNALSVKLVQKNWFLWMEDKKIVRQYFPESFERIDHVCRCCKENDHFSFEQGLLSGSHFLGKQLEKIESWEGNFFVGKK